jgi:hypothetical protein
MKHKPKLLYRLRPRSAVPAEAAVDLLNRGVSVAGIASEWLTAKRSRPEMAPQRLEKIESGPGNGSGSEDSNPQDVVRGRAADRARLRPTSRENDKHAPLQKKAPKALISLDAKLKSAPAGPSRALKARDLAGSRSREEPRQTEREHRSRAALELLVGAGINPTRKLSCSQRVENTRSAEIITRRQPAAVGRGRDERKDGDLTKHGSRAQSCSRAVAANPSTSGRQGAGSPGNGSADVEPADIRRARMVRA